MVKPRAYLLFLFAMILACKYPIDYNYNNSFDPLSENYVPPKCTFINNNAVVVDDFNSNRVKCNLVKNLNAVPGNPSKGGNLNYSFVKELQSCNSEDYSLNISYDVAASDSSEAFMELEFYTGQFNDTFPLKIDTGSLKVISFWVRGTMASNFEISLKSVTKGHIAETSPKHLIWVLDTCSRPNNSKDLKRITEQWAKVTIPLSELKYVYNGYNLIDSVDFNSLNMFVIAFPMLAFKPWGGAPEGTVYIDDIAFEP